MPAESKRSRILVTGAAGFVASHLGEICARRSDLELVGLQRPTSVTRILPEGFVAGVEADLLDQDGLKEAVREARPDAIIHLAGQSSVHESYRNPGGTLLANVLGTQHLLFAAEKAQVRRVLVVGSADEYGDIRPEDVPLREDRALAPLSPYAVSRVAQGALCSEFARRKTVEIVRTRTFPHTGKRRGAVFAESSFARQIAEIELERATPVIQVGNLDAVRDFSDVREVVEAYLLLLERGESGAVYNVCSGKGVAMREILSALVALSSVKVDIHVDPARLRPSDLPVLIGDPSRLRAATGFAPSGNLDRALADLLADWRAAVERGQKMEARHS
ncbi:MAG: GDP-mannose 4,6-dehydratase [Vicinamibacteria bacterium]|nr:GDP-mannose 4,6-dehydratase [Vicinamibacteria bacterium]